MTDDDAEVEGVDRRGLDADQHFVRPWLGPRTGADCDVIRRLTALTHDGMVSGRAV